MADSGASSLGTVTSLTYKTTRPIIPLTTSRQVTTTRINDSLSIQLRPFSLSDLTAVHQLRTQIPVMVNTIAGVPDADLAASQKWMDRSLSPNDLTTFNLMIWVQQSDKDWQHIGCVGAYTLDPVPHIGYMLRTEWWGKTIATNAVKAFLRVWWALDRKTVELNIADAANERDAHFMRSEMEQQSTAGEGGIVPEILWAEIEEKNLGSKKVIERAGFVNRGEEGPYRKPRGS